MTSYWCEHALVGDRVVGSIRITVGDGKFAELGPDQPRQATDEVLAGLVFPGFANPHSHAFHRALRGRTQLGTGSFWTWREQMYQAASRLDPISYHKLARATFAEMVCAGIAVVGEFHYLHHRADGSTYSDPNAMGEAVLAAASDAGIRITLLDTAYLHGGLEADGYVSAGPHQKRFTDRSAIAWAERSGALNFGPEARMGAAIHSVRAVDPESIATIAAVVEERNASLHVHVSEQPLENEQCLAHHGLTPVDLLASAGALGPSTTIVHATHLSDADISTLAASGSGVCICPTTERDLADGIGPAAALAGAGVALSLGSDSNAVIDPFEEARALELNERLDSGVRGNFSAAALLDAATVNGHMALGWTDAGRIEVGSHADLVAVRTDSVRTAGTPLGATMIYATGAADITDVVVSGRRVVRDGRHCEIEVADELRRSIEGIMVP